MPRQPFTQSHAPSLMPTALPHTSQLLPHPNTPSPTYGTHPPQLTLFLLYSLSHYHEPPQPTLHLCSTFMTFTAPSCTLPDHCFTSCASPHILSETCCAVLFMYPLLSFHTLHNTHHALVHAPWPPLHLFCTPVHPFSSLPTDQLPAGFPIDFGCGKRVGSSAIQLIAATGISEGDIAK